MKYFISANIKFVKGGQKIFDMWSLEEKEPIEDTYLWMDKWVLNAIIQSKSQIVSVEYNVDMDGEKFNTQRDLKYFQ